MIQEDGAVTSSGNRGFLLGEGFTKKLSRAGRPKASVEGWTAQHGRTARIRQTSPSRAQRSRTLERLLLLLYGGRPQMAVMRVVVRVFADYSSVDRASGQHARAREWFAGLKRSSGLFPGLRRVPRECFSRYAPNLFWRQGALNAKRDQAPFQRRRQ